MRRTGLTTAPDRGALQQPAAEVPTAPAHDVSDGADEVARSLDGTVARMLAPIAFVLTATYGLSFGHRLADPLLMATTPPTAAVLVVGFAFVGVLFALRPPPPRLAHPVIIGALLCISLETVIRGLTASTDLPWAIMGSGAVLLSPAWFATGLAAVLGPWAASALLIPGSPWAIIDATYPLDLIMACLYATVIFVSRYAALRGLERARTALRRAAVVDQLTGVGNRRSLAEHGAALIERSRRQNEPVWVLCLDIDGFKAVNDRFGHASGDRVLEAFGAALRECCRADDVAVRLGGDEFVVIAATEDPEPLAARIESAAARVTDETSRGLTVSIGVVGLDPGDARSLESLIGDADRAMYAVKQARKVEEEQDRRSAEAA